MLKELDAIDIFLKKPEIPDYEKAREILHLAKLIGWDKDQIISATEYSVIGSFNRQFECFYNPESVSRANNIKQWLMRDFGFDEKYARHIEIKFWHDPELLYKAFPNPDAAELSLKFNKSPNKKEQFVVTARMNTSPGLQKLMYNRTHQWMTKWFPWIPDENVYVDKEKGGSEYKVKTLCYLNKVKGLNVFFEDYDSNAYKIVESIPGMWVILVSKELSYAEDFKIHPRILRLPSMRVANSLVAQSY